MSLILGVYKSLGQSSNLFELFVEAISQQLKNGQSMYEKLLNIFTIKEVKVKAQLRITFH